MVLTGIAVFLGLSLIAAVSVGALKPAQASHHDGHGHGGHGHDDHGHGGHGH